MVMSASLPGKKIAEGLLKMARETQILASWWEVSVVVGMRTASSLISPLR